VLDCSGLLRLNLGYFVATRAQISIASLGRLLRLFLGCAAQNRGLERADINREFGPSSGPSSRSRICGHIPLGL
jgi:hypothetical protein